MLTKSSTDSQVRQYNFSNALAYARIEGVLPTMQLEK